MKDKCNVCHRYDKVEGSNLCEACKAIVEWSIKHDQKLMFSRKNI